MKMKYGRKIGITLAVLILLMSIASIGYAAVAGKYYDIKAWMGDMKIFRNGQQVQLQDPPMIINGRTYLPVRAVAEMLNKDVTWDAVNYHVGINDKQGDNVTYLQQQLYAAQLEIARLNKLIDEDKVMSISDLEKALNKEHDEYRDVEFTIDLKGDEDDIEVRIYTDLSEFDVEWDALSDSRKTTYIQGIVDDILAEYEDADIEGYIEDTDTDKKILSFTVSSKGVVSVGSSGDLGDLEDDLNDYYEDYYKGDGVYFAITLKGDEDDIQLIIRSEDSKGNLLADVSDDLTKGELETVVKKMYEDIIEEFPDADVDGYFEDKLGDIDFTFS